MKRVLIAVLVLAGCGGDEAETIPGHDGTPIPSVVSHDDGSPWLWGLGGWFLGRSTAGGNEVHNHYYTPAKPAQLVSEPVRSSSVRVAPPSVKSFQAPAYSRPAYSAPSSPARSFSAPSYSRPSFSGGRR